MAYKPKTTEDVYELMRQKREQAAQKQKIIGSDDAEPLGQSAAEVLKKSNETSSKESLTNGHKSEHDVSMNSVASSSVSKKKRKKKKNKNANQNQELNSTKGSVKDESVATIDTGLESGSPASKRNKKKKNKNVGRNQELNSTKDSVEEESVATIDTSLENGSPTSKKNKKKKNKNRRSIESMNDNAQNTNDIESVEDTSSLSNSKKKRRRRKSAEQKIDEEKPDENARNGVAVPTGRKRRASQRAEQQLALVPAEERNDDSDPDDTNYVVESPDEDGKPKRAKVAESEDEDDEWSHEHIRNRLRQAFDGGVFYDSEDDDTEMEYSDGSDDPSGFVFPHGYEDNNEASDDEAEDNDDFIEDLEFDEDDLYGSDSDVEAMVEGAFPSHGNMNSDEEIDNVISTIRNKDEDLSDSDQSKTDSEIEGPVDDLEELADADEEDLYAEDDDEGEDLDEFINDEIEMASDAEDDEEESEISEVEEGPKELSEQFCDHGVLKCVIDGYQTNTDNGSLLSLSRTGAPKSRSGAFRSFKFTEKKVLEPHSVDIAEDAFSWLIGPLDVNYFYKFVFQRMVYYVARRDQNYYKGLFSSDTILHLVQNNVLKYKEHVNVVEYTAKNGSADNSPDGKVFSRQLKTLFESGNSIELLNPQCFVDELWYLCEILQELTHSYVGSKIYLTPKNSAAFGPHCEGVDSIILQIEGKQYWRVWTSENEDEVLPDLSSGLISEKDMASKKLVFEGTLEVGDVLYIPRGFYHAASSGNKHSLHISIEFSKGITFTHLMKSVARDVWDAIRSTDVLARRSLPPQFLEMNGVGPLDYAEDFEIELMPVVNLLLEKIKETYKVAIPSAIDKMAIEFMKTALPPMLSDYERKASIHGNQELSMFGDEEVQLTSETEVRLIRMHAQRLLYDEESKPYLGHRMNNSRVFEENTTLKTVYFEKKCEDGVKKLLENYPRWVKVRELECGKNANMRLAKLLYANGLLMVRQNN